MEKPLSVLVSEAKRGGFAFREIFDRLNGRVFSYAMSHVGRREDAVDITQETFIDLWKGLKNFTYRSDEEFYGFVFLIAKRRIARFYRERRETVPIENVAESETGYSEAHEDHRFLIKQIKTLSDHYQELLRLRYWGGMRLAEAAAVLGITESTAKVWHFRALQTLRANMQTYDHDGQ